MVEGRIFLTTDAVGGVWQYSLELARAYVGRGLTVDLVVLGPAASPERLAEAEEIAGLELFDTGLPLDWMAGSEAAVRAAARELAALARARGADLVHLNAPGLGCTGDWSAPIVATLHSCVASWWQAVRHPHPMPRDFVWRTRLVLDGLQRAHAVIVPSAAFAESAHAIYGDAVPIAVVHNGRSGAEPGRLAAAGSNAVFTCGRLWDEAKNAATIDAAAAMRDRPILAAGPVADPEGREIALPHLYRLGELSDAGVRRRLDRTGVFVSVPVYEPFGLGVLEAAQCGCALVLSDIPTFRELWGGTARFVDPHRPQDLARAIDSLSASSELRTELGRRAQQRAIAYGSTAMASATLAVYDRVLRRETVVAGGAG